MIVLLLALACAPKPASRSGDVTAPEAEDVNWQQVSVRLHMSEHFKRAQSARNAVIEGRLAEARVDLAWLADHETLEGEPADYGTWLRDMRVVAQTGVEATDVEGMASCVSGMAVECGGCHQALHVTPRMPVNAEAPDNTGGIKGHTARYGWVVDRMWTALAQPSDSAWTDAVGALRDPPMSVYDLGIADDRLEQVSPYADALNAVSTRALGELDAAGRAATYGEVVTTCAGCHVALKGDQQVLPGAPGPTALPDAEGPAALPEE